MSQRKAERAEYVATRQTEISAALASDIETLSTLLSYQKYFGPNNTPVNQKVDPEPTFTNYYILRFVKARLTFHVNG